MNTLPELQTKILKSSHINEIETLISLRAFLFDQEYSPWIILEDISHLNNILEKLNSSDIQEIKKNNIKNIKKLGLNLPLLYSMPKNKRLILIDMLNDMIESLLDNKILLIDNVRHNPFSEDLIYNYINKNKNYVNKDIISIYEKRYNDLNKIQSYLLLKNSFIDTCLDLALKNKLKKYWLNLWTDKNNYLKTSNTSIEKIVI